MNRGNEARAAHIMGMSTPKRVPAGTPTAGQFAPDQHSETGVTLDTTSEKSGKVDPVILGAMATRRHVIAEAEQAYERVCARGLADIATKRWPQAHALEMESWFENPDHLVVTGVYASGEGGRLPVTDAELHDFNFETDDVFEMTSALQTAPEGQGSEYMSSDSKLLGQTFDVDKARGLPITDEEIAQDRTDRTDRTERTDRADRADATIGALVAKHIPGARSWAMTSDGTQVSVYDGAADAVTSLSSRDSRVSPEDSAAMEAAVAELNEANEDGDFHPHYREIS